MAFETISLGITLSIPTSGTVNWGPGIKEGAWRKISEHDHTGSGKGLKLDKASLTKNLTDYQVTKTVGAGESAYTVNFNDGKICKIDLSSVGVNSNLALTLLNGTEGGRYTLILVSNATYRFSFATSIKWAGGENPTASTDVPPQYFLSTAAGKIDKIELYHDGSSYLATWEVGFL